MILCSITILLLYIECLEYFISVQQCYLNEQLYNKKLYVIYEKHMPIFELKFSATSHYLPVYHNICVRSIDTSVYDTQLGIYHMR